MDAIGGRSEISIASGAKDPYENFQLGLQGAGQSSMAI